MDYEAVKTKASDLLAQHTGGRFPVPVIEIATRLGIQVVSDEDYQNHKDGHIEIDEQRNATIVVNDDMPPNRKRFTIAHEIAHFVYDSDYLEEHGIIDRDGDAADVSYRDREKRANFFAAQLLMPEEQFIEQWIALRCVDKIAEYFSVSKEAAKYRAINIGLIPA